MRLRTLISRLLLVSLAPVALSAQRMSTGFLPHGSLLASSVATMAPSRTTAAADAVARAIPAPAPRIAVGEQGITRIGYILIGAVAGAAFAAGTVLVLRSSADCCHESKDVLYPAAGGMMVGGFIGSIAYGLRHSTTVPPIPADSIHR